MNALYKRKYFKLKSEINIVPFLDVLLVLLLISITVSPVLIHNVEVELPDISNSNKIRAENSNPSVIIEVARIGRYNILVGDDRVDQLKYDQIFSDIQHRLKLNPKTIFLIGGEKSIPYNEIMKILNLLHNAGVKSVSLMTKPI